MRPINIYFYIILVFMLSGTGCDLNEIPKDVPVADDVFNTEDGLESYANSFYAMLPAASDITHGDNLSDFAAVKQPDDLIREGRLNSRTTNRWNWEDLRDINYFLVNNTSPDVDAETRNNYNGIARFFRAWFYFKKLKKYGDVPWINKPLEIDSKELENPRDPRTLIVDSIMADLDYAIAHISENNEASRSMITKDVALALKSRVGLFEGTYRKYHQELNLSSSVNDLLQKSIDASQTLMNKGTYEVFNGNGIESSFKDLFTNTTPIASSTILCLYYSTALGLTHDANWWFTSASYGNGLSFTKQFINTFLMEDGTPFTNKSNYETMSFFDELQNRDSRLAQSIRGPQYEMLGATGAQENTPPNFTYTVTGYQPIKFDIPDKHFDDRDFNDNIVILFRYAEVLLNYAEARAELGELTDADWNNTIGVLRRRGGITAGTTTLPTQVDPYLQHEFFSDIADPVILEIRRERGIELALEGFRFDDLRRWKEGELLAQPWIGMYVSSANTPIDITGDGQPDVYFYTGSLPDNRISGVQYVNLGTQDWHLSDGDHGNIMWLENLDRTWSDNKYLYPLNILDIQKNPNLEQNPGWENN